MGIALFRGNYGAVGVSGITGFHSVETFGPSGLMSIPRLGTSFATRVRTFGPSGLMDAPRLGTLFATQVWAFRPSGLMVAPRLETSFATWVWTFAAPRLGT